MSHDLHVWWKFVHIPTGVFFNVVRCVDGELSIRVDRYNHWTNVGLGERERGRRERRGRGEGNRRRKGKEDEGRRALSKKIVFPSTILVPPTHIYFSTVISVLQVVQKVFLCERLQEHHISTPDHLVQQMRVTQLFCSSITARRSFLFLLVSNLNLSRRGNGSLSPRLLSPSTRHAPLCTQNVRLVTFRNSSSIETKNKCLQN